MILKVKCAYLQKILKKKKKLIRNGLALDINNKCYESQSLHPNRTPSRCSLESRNKIKTSEK